jgi:hypothetical protein
MVEKRVNDRKNGQRQNGYGDESEVMQILPVGIWNAR